MIVLIQMILKRLQNCLSRKFQTNTPHVCQIKKYISICPYDPFERKKVCRIIELLNGNRIKW